MKIRDYVAVTAILLALAAIFIMSIRSNDSGSWIGFWGNIVGGIIGGIVTYFSVKFTLTKERENVQLQISHEIDRKTNEYLIVYKSIDRALEILIFQVQTVEEMLHPDSGAVGTGLPRFWGLYLSSGLDEYRKDTKDMLERLQDRLPAMYDYYSDREKDIFDRVVKLSTTLENGNIKFRETYQKEASKVREAISNHKNKLLQELKSLV